MTVSELTLQDSTSFSELFSRTHLIIFRFIFGLYGASLEEVEDLTSEVYMRAWRGRTSFSGDDHDALCWLFTIARHLVIDIHRKRIRKHGIKVVNWDDSYLESSSIILQQSPEEKVINREQFDQLWKIMQDLPYERREMIVLRFMVGWQVKQIAQYLKIEENTVSVYIRRSLEQIRQSWK